MKTTWDRARRTYSLVLENREKILEAFIAETGLPPSKIEMVEEDDRLIKIWYVRERKGKGYCIWELADPDNDVYTTQCSDAFMVACRPVEFNKMTYCPYCGNKIKKEESDE